MKMTLLDMVQDILNDLDGDTVNSIGDTEESMQVAQIIKTIYYEMSTLHESAHQRKATTLVNLSDAAHPNYLKLPKNTMKLESVMYNNRKQASDKDRFEKVGYLTPVEFLFKCNCRDPEADNVTVITDFGGVRMNIVNDKAPDYWTSFDDLFIVFDSWPNDYTSTLIETNSQAILLSIAEWEASDEFVPVMPAEFFPGLLAEAKSAASYKLRQVADQKAEQQSKRQQRVMGQRGWAAAGGIEYPDYGRPTRGNRVSRFRKD